MRKELLKGLTEEQLEKARSCKNGKDLLKLAKQEGIQLTDEQLAMVNGGNCVQPKMPAHRPCPNCNSNDTVALAWDTSENVSTHFCKSCGHRWDDLF